MQPSSTSRQEYIDAFRVIAERIAEPLRALPDDTLPIKMYIAGGAALHFYTGERVSQDIDAVFSHRIILPDNLEVTYRDVDGTVRLLYFDRQYNDTYALMHEDAYDDSIPLNLKGMDPRILDIRLLSAIDLAVSKISRFSDQDREDISTLAKHGLITADALRQRAEEAKKAYIGNLDRLENSIALACNIVEDVEAHTKP